MEGSHCCINIKLNKVCYAIRSIKPFLSVDILRMIYFSYVMSYGIIFWGNSHPSNNIFKIKKRIIRMITNTGSRDSCCQLFKQLQILSLPSQYIFFLLVFVNKKRNSRFEHTFQPQFTFTFYKLNIRSVSSNVFWK